MKFTAILLVFCLTLQVAGQTETEKYYFRTSEKIVKFDVAGMFNQIPAFGFELESVIDNKSSVLFGFGIIPSFFQPLVGNQSNGGFNVFNNGFGAFNDNGLHYLRGYKLSAGGRLYAFKKATRYISIDAHLRHLIIRDKDVLYGMEPFDNNNNNVGWQQTQYAYFQSVDMLFNQFRVSIDAKLGFQRNVGSHFVFDCNIGARLETTTVQSQSSVPEGGTLIVNFWNPTRLNLYDDYKNTRIMPVLGLKLGYKLK